ncbi:MAG: xylulokinase [Acidobacteriota bacterium]|nr:xylulokinase [Acidobacteriota bacterium]MDW3228561.1 xylulokinase [Acidobacteriota bacterium]MDY0230864.1 xylulokinase [Candidatus Saccharicenans sp.]
MEAKLYALGLDSGTQGTKVLVVEIESGKVEARSYSPHKMISGLQPGESEQHPRDWIEAADRAIDEAVKTAGIKPEAVVCLGISAQQHGFVPLDKEFQPIRPAKLWNDTSTIEETEEIIRALGGKEAFIEKLGINLAVGYTASKILWLKKHEPENYNRLYLVLLPHNYLNLYLTGQAQMEYGDASGTGLMDIRKRCWHQEALKTIDPSLKEKLPPISHPAEPVGYIRDKIAQKFGFGRVLVSAGGGDNMMAAIGTGNVVTGIGTVSLGTSGTVFFYSPEALIDPEGEIAAFCDSTGGWLPLLCTMNVTNVTELFKKLLNLSNEELEKLIKDSEPGAAGLIFLPFIDGERVPTLPKASAVLFGLNRLNFNRTNLARAIVEGTILNLGYGLSRMKSLGLRAEEFRATGGGARSQAWLQIVADIFVSPVVTVKEPESAAYGAALQAIWCYLKEKRARIGLDELTKKLVKKEAPTIIPNYKNSDLYQELQSRFNSLWQSLFQNSRDSAN